MIETELERLVSPLRDFSVFGDKLDGFYELFQKYQGRTLHSILNREESRTDFVDRFINEIDKLIQSNNEEVVEELSHLISSATKFLDLYMKDSSGHATYWSINDLSYTLADIIKRNELDVSLAISKLIRLTSYNMVMYKLSSNDITNLFNILQEWDIDTKKVSLYNLANRSYDFRDKEVKPGLSKSSLFQ